MTIDHNQQLQRPSVSLSMFLRWCGIVLIMLIPVQIYLDVYGDLSITVATCVVLIMLAIMVPMVGGPLKFIRVPHALTSLLLLFIGSMISSTIIAHDPVVAIKYTLKWTALSATYFIIYWLISLVMKSEEVLTALILTGCFITVLSNTFFVLGPQGFQEFLKSPTASFFMDSATIKYGDINWFEGGGTGGTFFNRNWYAAFLGMIIPYCVLHSILLRQARFFWIMCSFILFSGLLTSMSRGGWLGFVVFIGTWFAIQKKQYWKFSLLILLMFLCTLALLVLAFPSFLLDLVERTASVMAVDYKINRILIWNQSLNAMLDNPLFGIGVANNPIGSAHSNFLQIAVEQGIIGLLIYLFMILIIVRKLIDTIKSARDNATITLGVGLLGSWVWFLTQGCLETTLMNDKLFMTVMLVLAITVQYIQENKSTE